MPVASVDDRTPERLALDELIAAEPQSPLPAAPADGRTFPMEELLAQLREPVAIQGIVENGVVRPVDGNVRLREHARVLIIAAPVSSAG